MPKSHEPSLCTAIYHSACQCNVEAFRRAGEPLPPCWSCGADVEWSLEKDLSILDEFPSANYERRD